MQLNSEQQSSCRRRGQNSRDHILASLQNQPDQSRDQLMQSADLTYNQVRDQTRNLCIEGLILSHIGTRGERRYLITGDLSTIALQNLSLALLFPSIGH